MYSKILSCFICAVIMFSQAGCAVGEDMEDSAKQFASSLENIKSMIENGEEKAALEKLAEAIQANMPLIEKLKNFLLSVESISAAPGSRAYREKLLEGDLPDLSRDELRALYLFPVLMMALNPGKQSCTTLNFLYFAALKGYALAQYRIAEILNRGDSCKWPKDLEESVHWYAAAGEQGHSNAQINHAISLLYGIGVKQDIPEGNRILLTNAENRKNPKAQYLLGVLMEEGKVAWKDEKAALHWLRRSAEQGYAPAQVRYGMKLWDKKEWNESRNWLSKAAEQGYPEGQYQLAKTHLAGIDGDSWLFQKAIKLFEAAARGGHLKAQTELGLSYWSGDIRTHTMEPNYGKAVKWLSKAAIRGDVRAQTYLGYSYNDGKGVEQNSEKAVNWWRRAAEQNFALAEEAMGWAYEKGKGVPRNLREARKWYNRAKTHGNMGASRRLEEAQFEKLARQDAGLAILLGLAAVAVLTANSPGAGEDIEYSQGCFTTFGNFNQSCDMASDIGLAGMQAGIW